MKVKFAVLQPSQRPRHCKSFTVYLLARAETEIDPNRILSRVHKLRASYHLAGRGTLSAQGP